MKSASRVLRHNILVFAVKDFTNRWSVLFAMLLSCRTVRGSSASLQSSLNYLGLPISCSVLFTVMFNFEHFWSSLVVLFTRFDCSDRSVWGYFVRYWCSLLPIAYWSSHSENWILTQSWSEIMHEIHRLSLDSCIFVKNPQKQNLHTVTEQQTAMNQLWLFKLNHQSFANEFDSSE